MTEYVGLDAHKESFHATAMDENGEVALEASYFWEPVYDELEEMGFEVKLAHPKKTRIIADEIEVTDEKTGDSEVFGELIEDLDLEDYPADKAYDSEEIFELLEERGVDPPPGVKLRRDAQTGLSPRGEAAKEFRELGYEAWKEKHEYGKWRSVRGFYSAVKRCFGETVRAASPEGMIREVKRKFALYNLETRI